MGEAGLTEASEQAARPRAGMLALAATFFKLGATVFGGMWAATTQLEIELAERRKWINKEEVPFLQVAATLIPAPKFMALGGLIGYRLRGFWGSLVAALALMSPGAIMVVAVVALSRPGLLSGFLAPVEKAVDVAVAGITFGAALRQLRKVKTKGKKRLMGFGLTAAVGVSIALGLPLLIAAAVGFTAGAFLIREG